MAIEIDSAGITRTAKKLGNGGTNILALKSRSTYDIEALDDATPRDEGESLPTADGLLDRGVRCC